MKHLFLLCWTATKRCHFLSHFHYVLTMSHCIWQHRWCGLLLWHGWLCIFHQPSKSRESPAEKWTINICLLRYFSVDTSSPSVIIIMAYKPLTEKLMWKICGKKTCTEGFFWESGVILRSKEKSKALWLCAWRCTWVDSSVRECVWSAGSRAVGLRELQPLC